MAITQTGVKHLHHAAQGFGIGVYFESNGHGTVVFHPNTIKQLNSILNGTMVYGLEAIAARSLQQVYQLINQTVGDAISDMLLIEAILACKSWTTKDWKNLYTDLPCRQLKVKVKDRNIFKCTDADRVLTEPASIQPKLNDLMGKF